MVGAEDVHVNFVIFYLVLIVLNPATFMKYVIGNWKMQMSISESIDLARFLLVKLDEIENVKIVVCPSFVALPKVASILEGSNISVGAQNCFWEDRGAYTGEISPIMLVDFCDYVICGHSERRKFFNETDEMINKKIKAVLRHQMQPVFCVGEEAEFREIESGVLKPAGINFIKEQLKKGLEGIEAEFLKKIIIAYEPVWAIGTGLVATSQQSREAIELIRSFLQQNYNQEIAQLIPVLYGGSIDEKNINDLVTQGGSDGFLVGGASVKGEEFIKIIKACV